MKLVITFLITLFITATVFAQQGINYKALIKDGSGNVVANQSITVQLSIKRGIGLSNEYTETHTPTTDANGIIIINIGEGTPDLGDYNSIDWGADNHFLNVEIDTGSGPVDMGTTQFMAVPYALNALSSSDNYWSKNGNNIYTLNDNAGIGIDNPQAKLDILGGDWDLDAGNPGDLRIGNPTHNFRIGVATGGGGAGITRMYANSNALFLGSNNAPTLILEQDGSIIAPSLTNILITSAGDKALITKEYADVNLGSTGLEALNEGNGLGWRLKGRDPINYGNIGQNAVDLSFSVVASESYGATGNYAIATGVYSLASGTFSTAMGTNTTASGDSSIAMGNSTTASGINSTAMGTTTTASGDRSIAMGNSTTASGINSTAMGVSTTASGNSSTAMGSNTKAESFNNIAIGAYNVGGGDPINWIATDKLFEIGNGTSNGNRNNALTVLKNGNVGIGTVAPNSKLQIVGGNITVDGNVGIGTSTPNAKLQIAGTNGISLQITGANDVSPAGGAGAIVMGNTNGLNLALDDNEIMARNNGVLSTLNLNIEGGTVETGGKIDVRGLANLNKGIASGTALQVNGSEALWYNGTYFSWGFGGSANYFADNIGIGVTIPVYPLHVIGDIYSVGDVRATNRLRVGAFQNFLEGAGSSIVSGSSLLPTLGGPRSIGAPSQPWSAMYSQNGFVTTSDLRLKKDIKTLEYGLKEVLLLKPITYKFKNDKFGQTLLGLGAQDVEKIIPETVLTHVISQDETTGEAILIKAENLSINYPELIPVLIKALQEQQEIIENQSKEINALTSELITTKETQKEFDTRLKQIEQLLNTTQQ